MKQFVIFGVIVFPFAAFVLFRDLSHKNAWLHHTFCVEGSNKTSDRVHSIKWFRIFYWP